MIDRIILSLLLAIGVLSASSAQANVAVFTNSGSFNAAVSSPLGFEEFENNTLPDPGPDSAIGTSMSPGVSLLPGVPAFQSDGTALFPSGLSTPYVQINPIDTNDGAASITINRGVFSATSAIGTSFGDNLQIEVINPSVRAIGFDIEDYGFGADYNLEVLDPNGVVIASSTISSSAAFAGVVASANSTIGAVNFGSPIAEILIDNVQTHAVPEPSSNALFAVAGLLWMMRRRK